MASLRGFCETIRRVYEDAGYDWSDDTVVRALEEVDRAYLQRFHGEREVSRTQVVTCIQNFRYRLRQEHITLYGIGDEGLAQHLAATNLLTAQEQQAFLAMTQSRRLKAAKSAPYSHLTDASWGGMAWRTLGCPTELHNERSTLRQGQRREAYPLVYDPVGLGKRIVEVATELVGTLENWSLTEFETNLQSRRLLARLLSTSLFGMGCPRFTDLVPGMACRVGGGRAETIDDVYELHAGSIRYFHVSKTGCERARWRICLFPNGLCTPITELLRSRFAEIMALSMRQSAWIQRCLQTRKGNYCAWEGIHLERYAIVPTTFSCTPYCFKHVGLSLLPSLYYITNVIALRTDILACQVGHFDWSRNTVTNYGIFEVCPEQYTVPDKCIMMSDRGLYITDRLVAPAATSDANTEIVARSKKRRRCH